MILLIVADTLSVWWPRSAIAEKEFIYSFNQLINSILPAILNATEDERHWKQEVENKPQMEPLVGHIKMGYL